LTKNAGRGNDGPIIAKRENARHENAGHDMTDQAAGNNTIN